MAVNSTPSIFLRVILLVLCAGDTIPCIFASTEQTHEVFMSNLGHSDDQSHIHNNHRHYSNRKLEDLQHIVPAPFGPPSPEFCHINKLGDDLYISILKPCSFVFYQTDTDASATEADHFSCSNVQQSDNANTISTEMRRVLEWPDSCVAFGPRCYSLSQYPSLVNFTLFAFTEDADNYAMSFPQDANIVSVDCSEDYQAVQEAMQNLPQEMQNVAWAFVFFGAVVLISTIACIVTCCCCCIYGNKRRSHGVPGGAAGGYQPIDNSARLLPVPAVRVTHEPKYQAQVV